MSIDETIEDCFQCAETTTDLETEVKMFQLISWLRELKTLRNVMCPGVDYYNLDAIEEKELRKCLDIQREG